MVGQETTANTATDSYRLARYITLLIHDPDRLRDYVNHPQSRTEEMIASGLSEEEIGHLTTDEFAQLCVYLKDAGAGPAPDDETGPG